MRHARVASPLPAGFSHCLSSLLTGLAVSWLLSSSNVALAQTVDTTLWVANGTVHAVETDGSTIYIGGDFTQLGPATGQAVEIDPGTGLAVQPCPKVLGSVYAIAPDGNGGWYLGGHFTSVLGQPRTNLAHIDADGNLTPWSPVPNNAIFGLAVNGGIVYAAGLFFTMNAEPRNYLAALDGTTGAVTAWNPHADWYTRCLAVHGGKVYIGGGFSKIGGTLRSHIAAVSEATGALDAWYPGHVGGTEISALALSGGNVYVGGFFQSVSGSLFQRKYIAAFNATTGAVTDFNPNANGKVTALAVSGDVVYAGGSFTTIGGAGRNRIAALSASGAAIASWNPDAGSGSVEAIVVSGSTVYVGGQFDAIGGQTRSNLAALDVATGAATAWNPAANLLVRSVAVSGGRVFAGGDFTSVGAQPRRYLAALDAGTGTPTAWNPGANDHVLALSLRGGILYAGGRFTSIGGQPRNRIAALDAASGNPTPWDPNANNDVTVLAPSGSTVYAGGKFTSIGGQARNRIAALDDASGLATPWDPNANNEVLALAPGGGKVYAGGRFTAIGGQPRGRIAALDEASGVATAWNPDAQLNEYDRYNPNPAVYALAVTPTTVYVGGHFTDIGGAARRRIAALDVDTGGATAWNPHASSTFMSFQPWGMVTTLRASGNLVYAGGYFTGIGGAERNRIAALDAATGLAAAWNPNASLAVYALALGSGRIYAGGAFSSIGGQPQAGLAAITAVDIPTSTWLSPLEAAASVDGIELRWRFGDEGLVTSVDIERAPSVEGPWIGIEPERRVELGVTVALDRTAGDAEHFYRLVVQSSEGGREIFGPVSASRRVAPSQSGLTRLSPNPTPGGTQVHYAVARAGRVRLDVVDVSGRVVATLAEGVHGPGRHVVDWDGVGRSGRLSPGLHFVRLVAPDGVTVARLAIVR